MARLGRVTDPAALDADAGTRARLSVKVPTAWLAEGAQVEVTAPRLMQCARCGGGGCDGCGRSGAVRGPREAAGRTLRVHLPGGSETVRLRLPDPFDDGEIAQLILTVAGATEGDAAVRRVDGLATTFEPPLSLWWLAALAAALAAAWLIW